MKMAWMISACLVCLCWATATPGAVDTDWAYHDGADGQDDRTTEKVAGESFSFVDPPTVQVPSGNSVALYVLTANQFAGEAEEEVWVRLWNGSEIHWVKGSWVKNILLGEGTGMVGKFHDQPDEGTRMVDLWKVVLAAEAILPGDNHYLVQLKSGDRASYLLREPDVEMGGRNNLGQAWSNDEAAFFGRDWKLEVLAPTTAQGQDAE